MRNSRSQRSAGRSLGLLLAVALVGACEPPKPDYLFVEPTGAGVRIELRHEIGVFERREVPLPLADCGVFALVPGQRDRLARLPPQEVWRITTFDPDVTALGIDYGVVPPGFVQVRPQGRAAPPLVPGDRYIVECTGHAIGVTEFRMPYPDSPLGFQGSQDVPAEPDPTFPN